VNLSGAAKYLGRAGVIWFEVPRRGAELLVDDLLLYEPGGVGDKGKS
jgi:hypothetical protein